MLCDLALNLLQRAEEAATLNLKTGQLEAPLPVFVKLTDFNPLQEAIENFVAKHLATMNGYAENFARVFRDRTMNFVVLLDGVDEVSADNLPLVKQQIAHFIEAYPHIKAILTTRPGIFTRAELAARNTLHLLPLSFEQVVSRIEAESSLGEFRALMVDLLRQEPSLYDLLANPRMLAEAIKNLDRALPLSLGNVVEAAVEGFFKTESDKLGSPAFYMPIYKKLFNVADLLWNTDELRTLALPNIEHYSHFIKSGVLEQDRHTIRFFSRYFVDYLLAQQLNQDPKYLTLHEEQICSDIDRYRNIVRMLANWYDKDISNVGSFVGKCLADMNDSHTLMAVLLERQYPGIANVQVVQDWLLKSFSSLQTCQNYHEVVWNLVEKLTSDQSSAVFDAMLWLLQVHPNLLPSITGNKAIQLLSRHEQQTERFDQLARTLLSVHKLQVEDISVYILERVLALKSDYGLLFELYDWSRGVPASLIREELLSDGVDDQIKSAILQKLLNDGLPVPSEWESALTALANHPYAILQDTARRLLGLEPLADSGEPVFGSGGDQPDPRSSVLTKMTIQVMEDYEQQRT